MKTAVFIHGMFGHTWEYRWLLRHAKSQGFSCHEFIYAESFGQISLIDVAQRLGTFLKNLDEMPSLLVGFSQGGVIAAIAAEKHCKHPMTVFTICSPFCGSLDAYMFNRPGIRDLRFNSPMLSDLRTSISKTKNTYVSMWTPFDLMVTPGWSGRVGESHMILCPLHPLAGVWRKTAKIFCRKIQQIK